MSLPISYPWRGRPSTSERISSSALPFLSSRSKTAVICRIAIYCSGLYLASRHDIAVTEGYRHIPPCSGTSRERLGEARGLQRRQHARVPERHAPETDAGRVVDGVGDGRDGRLADGFARAVVRKIGTVRIRI